MVDKKTLHELTGLVEAEHKSSGCPKVEIAIKRAWARACNEIRSEMSKTIDKVRK